MHEDNYTKDEEIIATQRTFSKMYPSRPDLYKRATLRLGELLRKQKIKNGCIAKHKYKKEDVEVVVKYMLKRMRDDYPEYEPSDSGTGIK